MNTPFFRQRRSPTRSKCIATSNKCLTSSNKDAIRSKKLLGATPPPFSLAGPSSEPLGRARPGREPIGESVFPSWDRGADGVERADFRVGPQS